jgi:type IV secretion system protein TrbB
VVYEAARRTRRDRQHHGRGWNLASQSGSLNGFALRTTARSPDGLLFIDRLGQGVAPAGVMSPAAAEILIGSVAHALQSEADNERPIISGELPIGGHRFEGLLPPIVSGPAFTIRRRASRLIPFAEYLKSMVMTDEQAAVIRPL